MAYTAPTVAEFQTRFPEFEDQEEELITALLAEAGRQADDSWNDTDRKNAVMYLAAHLTQTSGGSYDTGGLRSVSLGSISVTYADSNSLTPANLRTTSYGGMYEILRRQNRGGPRVTGQ
jgi:hypothetical protein